MVSNLNNWSAAQAVCRLLQKLVFCCAVGALPGIVLAGTASPYGEYFVRLGATWPDGGPGPPQSPPAAGPGEGDSKRFENQLDALEKEGGPYADALAEPLADLARMHRRAGDLERAQQAYQRALHVVRINDGLYSERQVPILRELFETYRLTGDMVTLDARYDYFFRLYGSGQPPYTPVRIGAALEYLRWQREALRLGLDGEDSDRLLALYTLNEQLLQAVAADPGAGLADYRALALSQLRNLYLLSERYEPKVEAFGPGGVTTAMPTAWDEQDTTRKRLEVFQRNALSRGRALLEELIARTPPEQLEALAATWLELADWNQWNDRRPEALAAYREVEQLLLNTDRAELLQQWLGQPVELPANGAFWQPRPLAGGDEPVVVHARYDVSATGKAGNIEVTTRDSANDGKAGRVRRSLAQTRFRPRMVNGEPVAGQQLERDYQVLD